jgi:hypothetical protein
MLDLVHPLGARGRLERLRRDAGKDKTGGHRGELSAALGRGNSCAAPISRSIHALLVAQGAGNGSPAIGTGKNLGLGEARSTRDNSLERHPVAATFAKGNLGRPKCFHHLCFAHKEASAQPPTPRLFAIAQNAECSASSPFTGDGDTQRDAKLMELDFPAPWTVVEGTGEFYVRDATGRTLGHFYWWGGATALELTQAQARHLAERFATLPV